jgi:hypothetical protein
MGLGGSSGVAGLECVDYFSPSGLCIEVVSEYKGRFYCTTWLASHRVGPTIKQAATHYT